MWSLAAICSWLIFSTAVLVWRMLSWVTFFSAHHDIYFRKFVLSILPHQQHATWDIPHSKCHSIVPFFCHVSSRSLMSSAAAT